MPGMEKTVEGIDLGFNNIQSLSSRVFDNFRSLRKLRLNHNFIQIDTYEDGWITEKLGVDLSSLNLAYNRIKKVCCFVKLCCVFSMNNQFFS